MRLVLRKNCDTIAAAVAGTLTERLQHLSRVAAITVFAKITPDVQAATLCEYLQDPGVEIRWAARWALWKRGQHL